MNTCLTKFAFLITSVDIFHQRTLRYAEQAKEITTISQQCNDTPIVEDLIDNIVEFNCTAAKDSTIPEETSSSLEFWYILSGVGCSIALIVCLCCVGITVLYILVAVAIAQYYVQTIRQQIQDLEMHGLKVLEFGLNLV